MGQRTRKGRPRIKLVERGPVRYFTFDLTYFDRQGRYVCSTSHSRNVATVKDTDLPIMPDYVSYLRTSMSRGLLLPDGRECDVGYVLIDYFDSCSHLLVAPRVRGEFSC